MISSQKLLLSMLALGMLSCGKTTEDETNDFRISVGPDAPFILPVSIRSCKGEASNATTEDVSANTVEFTRFNYKWSGAGTYTMSAIILRFSSNLLGGGKYECTIAGDELNSVLPAGGRVLSPTETDEQVARCAIRCGGIKVNSGVSSALIPGKAKVIGIETDTDGNSRPIVTETDIGLTYEKF
jgi:hypothetical protein